ncbi:tRNA pseudouridine(38-40) synthase TruA [Thermaerobacter sp. PB12/4term]|uniref:tRNA pseudouridine(38-40) synthase TruA n=1 Tax=Thermaerobacter sp. PB12/4term TaxID=2293838 RepID=UPI000E328BAB|nr:tRNA pseudouridine(38-40) synthase TruA [Thermaerobacter sp. PB12/4term]QIA28020.1 tRNA pseudouridine(38-40) synthase TruA [Thermaerobacter sp. PB12/4term]
MPGPWDQHDQDERRRAEPGPAGPGALPGAAGAEAAAAPPPGAGRGEPADPGITPRGSVPGPGGARKAPAGPGAGYRPVPAGQRTLRAVLAYDGTDFAGWQRQAGRRTVQQVVEEAISRLLGHPVRVTAAGRTDAGVHARAQVIHWQTARPFPVERLVPALRGLLPPDVAAVAAGEAPAGFHARYAARRKTYVYHLWRAPVADPLHRRWQWHLPLALDVAAMAEAARRLEGHHDFAAFKAAGSPVRNTRRTLYRCRLEEHGPLLRIVLEADGFLMHMARGIVGTLVEIGRGRWPAGHVDTLLATGRRQLAGPTAPAHGLILWRVEYDDWVAEGPPWPGAPPGLSRP